MLEGDASSFETKCLVEGMMEHGHNSEDTTEVSPLAVASSKACLPTAFHGKEYLGALPWLRRRPAQYRQRMDRDNMLWFPLLKGARRAIAR